MENSVKARAMVLILLALFLFQNSDAQIPRTGSKLPAIVAKKTETRVRNLEVHSKLMSRPMPYAIVFPKSYFDIKYRKKMFPVIVLLHGLSGNFRNWLEKSNLSETAFRYEFVIVTPEGGDGWYTDSATNPNDRFETYITEELIPEVEKKFRVKKVRESRAIAGLSMGGYGAIKFGLKYPEMFSLVGSFSGALDAPLRGEESKYLQPSIVSVFGETDSQTRKDNDIFQIVRQLNDEKTKSIPFIYFDCGTEDWLFKPNREFADLLLTRKIAHEFRELPGKHDWKFWTKQLLEFLDVAKNRLN